MHAAAYSRSCGPGLRERVPPRLERDSSEVHDTTSDDARMYFSTFEQFRASTSPRHSKSTIWPAYLVARYCGISAGVAPGGVLEERERYESDDGGDGDGLQVDGQVVTSP